MAPHSCKVTIRDLDGIDHTVHVTASALYEAVALGLAALHSHEWVADIATGSNEVKVSVINIPVEHSVKMNDFYTWLNRPPRSPRDLTYRARIREILGLPKA